MEPGSDFENVLEQFPVHSRLAACLWEDELEKHLGTGEFTITTWRIIPGRT